ncbi:MAG: cytochrome c-type biogenesis protein CcmH [Burkholderiaceae bacterium]|jgi:cytochrome c-type biogenesis protein CcmH|nr:cytochrome c-type biogenesis protein CcmH [Burkholderiaceae bacterium]
MSIKHLAAAALLAASLGAPAWAQPAAPSAPPAAAPAAAPGAMTAQPTANDPVAAKREYELSLKLRCLVCQNQSIAESNAELAVDLRRQVREQVAAGKSDSQIIDFMTARYGDFVLYSPPLKSSTMLLWFGPALLVLIGLIIAWRVVRARKALPAQVPLTDADRERAAQLLKGEGNAK